MQTMLGALRAASSPRTVSEWLTALIIVAHMLYGAAWVWGRLRGRHQAKDKAN